MRKLNSLVKDFILFIRLTQLTQPIAKFFHFIYYLNLLIKYIYSIKGNVGFKDFYTPSRDYNRRFKLYDFIFENKNLKNEKILYLEFGVAGGTSFNRMLELNQNQESKFYGFDTFEGLPEDWGGFYKKGDMSHDIPGLNDKRGAYVKGLFQDSLVPFIESNLLDLKDTKSKRVIHMDADLYSATIFSLSLLYPYLKKGDIIFFDEFNVPLHEFKAFHEFVNNFYMKLEPIGSVNNFYQSAFEVN